ncbi:hypothetical protein IQ238_27640 [Pleurocapsales cyanobacterium LEGE 06147]|nr:hypothetical protein [Pleurocapsales cyanobacterium LEGE 06147]
MRTGRRIEQGNHQPHKGKPRHWRTREDPFTSVWEQELVVCQENYDRFKVG